MIRIFLGDNSTYDPLFTALPVYVVDINEQTGRKAILHLEIETGQWIGQTFPEGVYEPPKPTFVLPEGMANEFLKGMAEAAARRGIKTQDDSVREGKMEATEKHLEDMRRIVFGKDDESLR